METELELVHRSLTALLTERLDRIESALAEQRRMIEQIPGYTQVPKPEELVEEPSEEIADSSQKSSVKALESQENSIDIGHTLTRPETAPARSEDLKSEEPKKKKEEEAKKVKEEQNRKKEEQQRKAKEEAKRKEEAKAAEKKKKEEEQKAKENERKAAEAAKKAALDEKKAKDLAEKRQKDEEKKAKELAAKQAKEEAAKHAKEEKKKHEEEKKKHEEEKKKPGEEAKKPKGKSPEEKKKPEDKKKPEETKKEPGKKLKEDQKSARKKGGDTKTTEDPHTEPETQEQSNQIPVEPEPAVVESVPEEPAQPSPPDHSAEIAQINEALDTLKRQYEPSVLASPPHFEISVGSKSAFSLMNSMDDDKFYLETYPSDKVIWAHRIFTQLRGISLPEDDHEAWNIIRQFLSDARSHKIDAVLLRTFNEEFDFSNDNVDLLERLVEGRTNEITPQAFTSFCQMTGLLMFGIKEACEFAGVMPDNVLPYRRQARLLHKLAKLSN